MGIFDSLIGGIFGMASQDATNEANLQMMREQNQFNREEAATSRAWQERMWTKANNYNSPAQQMQRLTEAGLNPNLVYGNGTSDLTAAAVPSTNMARASSTPTLQNPSIAAMNIATQAKQMALLDAQINKVNSETRLTDERANTQNIVNQHEDERLSALVKNLSLDADFNEVTYNNRVALNNFELSNAKIDNYVKELNKLYLPEQLELSLRQGYQQLSNLVAQESLTWEQVKNVSTQTWFIGQQVNVLRSEVTRNLAQANAANASANASNAQAGYYGALTKTENETRQPKVQGAWESAQLTHEEAMRLHDMTPVELGKLTVDMNRSILEGNINWLKMATNRYGSGVVGAFMNSLNQGLNGVGLNDPLLRYRFNGYNPNGTPR